MSAKHNRTAARPSRPLSVPAAPRACFPDCRRTVPWDRFAARWDAKREDHDRFAAAVEVANANLPRGWRLPDELTADWLAQWAKDLFIGIIPQHDRLTHEEAAGVVDDLAALVAAVRFVDRYGAVTRACRFWFYELAGDPGLGGFPTVGQVRRYRPELDPRSGLEGQPGDIATRPRLDQRQFFEQAGFLLGRPSPEELAWLGRLAYRPDPLHQICSDPPRHHVWPRGQLQRVVPELAGALGISYPQVDDDVPMAELVRRVHNWLTDQARPALRASSDSGAVRSPSASRCAPSRAKRSTERGDGRVKLVAALSEHHQFGDGGCLNLEPINNNELARLADVAPSTASAFFHEKFKGHTKYKRLCRDPGKLVDALKLLNGEFAPHLLYGRRPADEDDRDDERCNCVG